MRDTKKLKKEYIFLKCFEILFAYLPIIIFFVYGFLHSTTVEKLSLSGTCMAAIVLGVLSVFKYKNLLKSVIWVLLVGLCIVIENMALPIIVCGISDMISELIFSPLTKHYKNILGESANADDTSEKIAAALSKHLKG